MNPRPVAGSGAFYEAPFVPRNHTHTKAPLFLWGLEYPDISCSIGRPVTVPAPQMRAMAVAGPAVREE